MPQGKSANNTTVAAVQKKKPSKTIKKGPNRPKPKKKTALQQKLQGGHTAQMEALLADKVKATNLKLRVLKPNETLIKDIKVKEAKRKEKYG